jgi:hypothetical protein
MTGMFLDDPLPLLVEVVPCSSTEAAHQALNKQFPLFTGRPDLVQRPRPLEDVTLIPWIFFHTSLLLHLVLLLSGTNRFCFFLITSFCLCEVLGSFGTHPVFEKPQKVSICNSVSGRAAGKNLGLI